MSGLAMQLLGSSRCASGAEHHISHFIEMQPSSLDEYSDALHGEKVGVGTLLACREYHRIKNEPPVWKDYSKASDDCIKEIFGEKLCDSIISENLNDCAEKISAELLKSKWNEISQIIEAIPTYRSLLKNIRY